MSASDSTGMRAYAQGRTSTEAKHKHKHTQAHVQVNKRVGLKEVRTGELYISIIFCPAFSAILTMSSHEMCCSMEAENDIVLSLFGVD